MRNNKQIQTILWMRCAVSYDGQSQLQLYPRPNAIDKHKEIQPPGIIDIYKPPFKSSLHHRCPNYNLARGRSMSRHALLGCTSQILYHCVHKLHTLASRNVNKLLLAVLNRRRSRRR